MVTTPLINKTDVRTADANVVPAARDRAGNVTCKHVNEMPHTFATHPTYDSINRLINPLNRTTFLHTLQTHLASHMQPLVSKVVGVKREKQKLRSSGG